MEQVIKLLCHNYKTLPAMNIACLCYNEDQYSLIEIVVICLVVH